MKIVNFLSKTSIWSQQFESIHNIFNQSLYFDSAVFDIDRKLWLSQRPAIYISTESSLALCSQLNENLIHVSNLNIQFNIKNLIEKIQHFTQHNEISDNLFGTIKSIGFKLTNENIQQTSKLLNCCDLNHFLNSIDSNYNQRNVYESLNNIYIENQTVPFFHFVEMIKEFNALIASNDTSSVSLNATSNLNELLTRRMPLGKFSFLFNQLPNKLSTFFNAYANLLSCLTGNKSEDELSLNEFTDAEMRRNNLLNRLSRSFDSNSAVMNYKSALHYNWTNEFISKIYFNFDSSDLNNNKQVLTNAIKIELAFYDQKITQLNQLNSFIWSNYKLLCQEATQLDSQLLAFLKQQICLIKHTCFDNNEALFNDYLAKKGYVPLVSKVFKDPIEIIKLGCVLAFLFAPVEPLDPFEYDLLIEKCHQDELTLAKSEINLWQFIRENKLKSAVQSELNNEEKQEQTEFYFVRENKSDYFFLKNEFENGLKQFCSERLAKLVAKLSTTNQQDNKAGATEEEFKNWIAGLDKFNEKISNTFYSFSDIVYLPVNGLSLIGYGMKALYTSWRDSIHQNENLNQLVELLYKYPYENEHFQIAEHLLELSNSGLEPKLYDELILLALMHLINSLRYSTHVTKCVRVEPTKTFIKICQYFNQRYRAYKLAKEAENKTEDYKYKTYGQKETSQELEDKELAAHFPTYVKYFNDFVRSELNDDKPIDEQVDDKEEKNEANQKQNVLIDIDFLMKSFDLIEIFIDLQEPTSQINDTDFFDRNLLKTFYNSYSLGTKIIKAYSIQPRNNIAAGSLQSHILYSSSVNFNNLSYYISDHKYIYDFYKDPNQAQVIKCKEVLKQFYKRIEHLLNEWENNPILIELIKLVKRIESFDLNDSLMKYLTGLELLVQKAQSWQLVESKMTSIEAEIKQVSLLIVEWRKFELTFWQKSLDIELLSMRNKTAQNWFNHVFSICAEYLKGEVDQNEFLFTLKQFMELSLTGDYFIRLKQLKLCYKIFSGNEHLTDCLWSVFSFYDTLYSKLINENISNEKQSIEKELKDFIDICRWQDMNYWALKQSVVKYNKGLFKIIKKFRSFLNQKIDLVHPKVATSLAKQLISLNLSKLNLTLPKKKLDELLTTLEMPTFNQKHYDKMKLICKKSLKKKCCKHNFNAALVEFSSQNYQLFYDLNQMSTSLNQQYELNKTNKETAGKHKKDIKNLLTQKLKYLSDLMKQLAHIGLSYRRGNLQIAPQQETISQVLAFKTCVYSFGLGASGTELEIGEHFNETNFAYFLCLDRYMSFKQLLDTREINTANKYTHLVPVEKFRGYVEHFFHLVHEQKQQLHAHLNDLFSFKTFKQTLNGIVSSVGLNEAAHDLTSYSTIKTFIVNTFEKIKQVELFFKSISSPGLIMNSFEVIKEKLNMQEHLLTDLKEDTDSSHPSFRFKFPNESFSSELAKFKETYSLNSDLNKNLNDLNSFSAENCAPFEQVFSQIVSQFESLNKIDDERQLSIVIYSFYKLI